MLQMPAEYVIFCPDGRLGCRHLQAIILIWRYFNAR